MDCFQSCQDRKHFQNYPHTVSYDYNSRGFRDAEWPADLTDAIWCIGDSFTVGLGSPQHHIWPQVLEKTTGRRTINVSMDGASNNWISKQSAKIINTVNPTNIIIMWSYVERRESNLDVSVEIEWQKFYKDVKDPSWAECCSWQFSTLPAAVKQELTVQHSTDPYFYIKDDRIVARDCIDELRTIQRPDLTETEHLENFKQCLSLLGNKNCIQSFVPDFAIEHTQSKYIELCTGPVVPPVVRLDRSRDGHHFDLATSEYLVKQLVPYLL